MRVWKRRCSYKKEEFSNEHHVKYEEFDSVFLADGLICKSEFLTKLIDLDLGTSAVSFRTCYRNDMDPQFLSPADASPQL